MAALRRFDDPAEVPASGERFLLPGPTGDLEALLARPRGTPEQALAVICHPHPVYGGSLDNKVVHTIARAFGDLGAVTLRFNFRGVGHSEGTYDEGVGERADMLAAVAWLRERRPAVPLWLAGFSFGAYVAHAGWAEAKAQRLLLVAPAVSLFAFGGRSEVTIPWLVTQGGEDEVIDPGRVEAWAAAQSHPPRFACLPAAGHFFNGQLIALRDTIVQEWSRLDAPAGA